MKTLRKKSTFTGSLSSKLKKKLTKFAPKVLSRHPSHSVLRGNLDLQPFRSIIRLGSTTTKERAYEGRTIDLNKVIEINTVQAIKNSASKLLMKQCFTREGVRTADWWSNRNGHFYKSDITNLGNPTFITELPYPIISKSLHGSRGEGNVKHDTQQQLEAWMRGKNLSNFIFEKYYNYSREYRLHVTEDGCFYACRKMLRDGTPDSQRWFRNDSNSVWILQENASFDQPLNWNEIVTECVKALRATTLDIAGFDVKVQSRLDGNGRVRTNPEFIVIESNSACSHGDITTVKYKEELNKLLNSKKNNE